MSILLIIQGLTLITLCVSVAWLLRRQDRINQALSSLQDQITRTEVALFEAGDSIAQSQSDIMSALAQSRQKTLYSSSDRNHKRAIDSIRNGMEAESLCRYYGLNQDEVSLLTLMHRQSVAAVPADVPVGEPEK